MLYTYLYIYYDNIIKNDTVNGFIIGTRMNDVTIKTDDNLCNKKSVIYFRCLSITT